LFVIFCCLAWAAFIFATSSTVITPLAFFTWFHENVFQDEAAFRQFRLFWGASWFIVVKGWHVLEFAVLTLLCAWAIDALTGDRSVGNLIIGAVLCLVYAATDEWHQAFVPERGGVFSDVLIDAVGVGLGAGFVFRRRRRACNSE
jgi:VanZ family protein